MEDFTRGHRRFGEEIEVEMMNKGTGNESQDRRGDTESAKPCSKNVTGASAYDLFKAMLCCALKR